MTPIEFWALVDQSAGPDGCWPWLGSTNGGGRGRIKYNDRYQYAYRVAWELTSGQPIASHLHACHHCDNPICVNPSHIFPGTAADNAQDAKAKGRLYTGPRPSGLAHGLATVPPEVIAQAVDEYRSGTERQEDIARRYGVAQVTFSNWLLGKNRRDSGITPGSKPFKPCGTRAAYERHRRNGERPCEACRLAELTEQRDRKARKRAMRRGAA